MDQNTSQRSSERIHADPPEPVDTSCALSLRRFQQSKYPGLSLQMVGQAISSSCKNAKEVPWSQLDAHSCRHCQTIILDPSDRLESSEISKGGVRIWELPIKMALTQIVDAALDGCVLCDWLAEGMCWNFNTNPENDDFVYISMAFEYGRDLHDVIAAQVYGVPADQAVRPNSVRSPLLKKAFRDGQTIVFDPTVFEIVVARGDPASSFVRSKSPSLAEEEIYDDISEFLSTQNAGSERTMLAQRPVNVTASTALPLRLVDVGTVPYQPVVSLVEAASLPHGSRYAALSYVWGGDQPLKTTSKNLLAHRQGMPFTALPATIQDAIEVTRRLRIRFIWIDSLCILQDDANDKSNEIAKMPEYYSGAAFTIVAAHARSVREGFLRNKTLPANYSGFAFKLPYRTPDGRLGSVNLVSRRRDLLSDLPINTRGWTYQETLLSAHLVVFHQQGIELCCNRECHGSANSYVKQVTSQDFTWLKRLAAKSPSPAEILLAAWPNILFSYSRRNLTDPNDKLLAISGIATEMGRDLPYTYMGGLWVPQDKQKWPTLIRQLLWYIGSEHSEYDPDTTYGTLDVVLCQRSKRPTIYRAPSWSWASVEGNHGYSASIPVPPDTREVIHFEVRNVSVDLEQTRDPFGAVKAGKLIVRTRLTAAKAVRQARYMPDTTDDEDLFKDTRNHDQIWCSGVLISRYRCRGLTLRQVNGDTYQRIGCFEFYHGSSTQEVTDMFKDCRDQTIVII